MSLCGCEPGSGERIEAGQKLETDNIKSICCGASTNIVGDVTKYYVCMKCGKACNILLDKK